MAATDGQIILAASRFGDTTPVYIRDFAKTELPAVAKIVKGQHQNLGVPTLSNPSLQSTALFLNAGRKYQILAQPIKIKEGRKTTNVGPKVLIPETYPGYFELLSEDGRSTRCIETVLDLSKRRNFRVLVREAFRCNHNSKTIHAGEILTTLNDNGKYLQCRTAKDEIVNLPLEAKAKFSPIAKEDSISGVHTVKNLLQKRMPIVVRLVYGAAPKGLKQPFVPELRLLGCIEVDRVFALPLQKDTDLIAVPLNAKIKLHRAKNMDQLDNFMEYARFLDKAKRLMVEARDRLQVVDLKLAEKEKKDKTTLLSSSFYHNNSGSSHQQHHHHHHHKSSSSSKFITSSPHMTTNQLIASLESGYVLRKSASCDSTATSKYGPSQQSNNSSSFGSIADEYDEIDQIYDYVRGFAPLPKSIHSRSTAAAAAALMLNSSSDTIPEQGLVCNSNNNNNTNTTSKSSEISKSHIDNSGNYSSVLNITNNNNNISNSNNIIHSSSNNNSLEKKHMQVGHHQQHPHHHHHHHHHQLNGSTNFSHHPQNGGFGEPDVKPIPPPIETIPSKKVPEKRQRPTLPKLYVKNVINHHQKATPVIIPTNGKDIEPQSPLFHIRYKSLSSLQLTPTDSNPTTPLSITPKGGTYNSNNVVDKGLSNNNMLSKSASTTAANHSHHNNQMREGTLDSSRSGGRTSGDSKLPEKKTRRLSRPRSLSNLVWELRPQKEKSKKKLYVHHYDHRPQETLYL